METKKRERPISFDRDFEARLLLSIKRMCRIAPGNDGEVAALPTAPLTTEIIVISDDEAATIKTDEHHRKRTKRPRKRVKSESISTAESGQSVNVKIAEVLEPVSTAESDQIVCKDCEGCQVCMHRRKPSQYKNRTISQICEHNRMRQQCRQCKGSQICSHDRRKAYCLDCDGSQRCCHRRRRGICGDCKKIQESKRGQ
jgi:hypothetical protein